MPELELSGEVRDILCQRCGAALMKLKYGQRYARWFYGCGKFPSCQHSFDADQGTGAPLPDQNEGRSKEWPAGHPESPGRVQRLRHTQRGLWRHLLADSDDLSEPSDVLPEAFPDNLPIFTPEWPVPVGGRARRK